MFSGRFQLPVDNDGAFFIDRDGVRFRHVLNFLRTGTIPSFDTMWRYEEIIAEADFFALEPLRAQAEACAQDLQAQMDARARAEEQQRAWHEERHQIAREQHKHIHLQQHATAHSAPAPPQTPFGGGQPQRPETVCQPTTMAEARSLEEQPWEEQWQPPMEEPIILESLERP